MRTVRRLLYRDVVSAVMFTALAFLSLFFFIDFVDQLDDIGKQGYQIWNAALVTLLAVPGHFYELFPIAVLIGSIYAMARFAQSSEFTILRTAGLGPGRALWLLTVIGLLFSVATFVVGDYVAPLSERTGVLLGAQFRGGIKFGRAGAWLKDHRSTPEGERSYSINVGSASAKGELEGVRIFEFDADGRLLTRVWAKRASVGKDTVWTLHDADVIHWGSTGARLNADAGDRASANANANANAPDSTLASAPDATPQIAADMASAPSGSATIVKQEHVAELAWPTSLSAKVVSAAVLPIGTMTTIDLFRYSQHLASNEQAAQRYEIQFWKKALYPFACLVMVALALPFAYLQVRSGGISFKVFGGIMLGISFVLLNNVGEHLGLLRDWTPWIVAATPSLLYLLLSLAAFSWLVRYR